MSFTCCVCHKPFETRKGMHLHIPKAHKIELQDYYHLYFPRKDLYTDEFIKFKDWEQYFASFFNSKDNMAAWFSDHWNTEKGANIAKEILKNRVRTKNLKYAPSQMELRTVDAPAVSTYQKMFRYNEFCSELGLTTRFKYGICDTNDYKEIKVLIDTREQLPLDFKLKEVKKLDVGDYTAAEPNYADVYVERKSVQDFFGTFFNKTNLERFERELKRALDYGFYVIVVVEDTLTNVMNYKSIFVKEKNFVKVTLHSVRDLMQKFNNVQFAFAYNRCTAKNIITRIFNQGVRAKDFDWQYLIDTRQI